VTIGNMIFGDLNTNTAAGWLLDNNSSTGNILTVAGNAPTITVNTLGSTTTNKIVTIVATITGTNGLVKNGPGTLDLNATETFTNTVTIKNGTLAFDVNATPSTDTTSLYTLGDSAGGSASLLINIGGGNLNNPIQLATGAVGTLTIGNYGNSKPGFFGNINLNGNNLTVLNNPIANSRKVLLVGAITNVGNVTLIDNGLGTSSIQGQNINNVGSVTIQGTCANATGILAPVFGAGVSAINYASSATGVGTFTAPANPTGLTINSSSTLALPSSGQSISLPAGLSNITLNANSSGSITIGGAIATSFKGYILNSGTGTGPVIIPAALVAGITRLSNVIQNSAASPLILSGANTYTVPTLVNSGTLLVNGAFTAAQKGSPITVFSGGSLGGIGGIANLVTIQPGGTLAPGTNTSAAVGTLTIINNGTTLLGALSLSGNLYFKLNKTGTVLTNDFVNGTTLLTNLGTGTLTLTNIGSTAITNGDKFTLFSAPLINGNTMTIVSSYGKFTNNLAIDGSVVAGTPAPIITSITPAAGTSVGSTSVTITGTGFSPGIGVNFGTVPAASVSLTGSTGLTVTTPPHAAGIVTVSVTNVDGQFATTSFTFVSIPPPAISNISPTNGPTTGGTSVTITGSNFVNGDTVQFDTTTPIIATFNSSTSLTVTTPAHAAGAVNVQVADANNQISTLTGGFTFTAPVPAVWIAPNGGGDGLWVGDTSNWTNGISADGLDQTADFSQGDFTGGQAVHLDASVTIGNAIFGTTDTNSAVEWMVDNNGSGAPGNILNLSTAVGIPTITVADPLMLGNNATIDAVVSGNQGLALTGGGMLTLGAADGSITNVFTGGIAIENGTLFINNNANDSNPADGLTLGSTNIGSSATLLLGGAGFPNPIILPSGAEGTLTIGGDPDAAAHPALTGPTINLNGNNLTFIAPSGSVGNSFFQNGVTGSGNLTLIQNGSGTVLNDGTFNNSGVINLQGTGSGTFNLGTLTANITTLNYDSSSATVVAPTINANINGTTINSTSSLNLPSIGGITIGSGGQNLTLNADGTGDIIVNSLSFQFAGDIANSGTGTGATIISASIFNNSGILNMIQNSATSPLILSGANYYTVPTLVSNGTLLVNCPLVAGQRGSPITIYDGGILGGTGGIGNLVSIQPGGTLAPGTNDGATIATLTITNGNGFSGALSLAGNLFFKLDNSAVQSSDFVFGTALLTNIGTGTLIVSNIGPPLNPGDTFQLFSSPLIGGNALTIVGPVPFINNLAVDGSIQVGSGSTTAPVGSATITGSNLNIVWQGGTNQNCLLLTATNLLQPLSTWTIETTNVVGVNGLSTNLIPISAGDAQRFYVLTIP
jgi:autotransporter-associated beta strand protein